VTEEQKQALIEWLKPQIDELQNVCDEIPFGLDSDSAMHLNTMRVALSALTAPPVACKKRLVNHRSGVAHHWTYHGEVDRPSSGDIFRVEVVPLYERPAPAADLAELVPEKASMADYYENVRSGEIDPEKAGIAMWDACRAEMLRKIEERS
jgi:hypothetical protein